MLYSQEIKRKFLHISSLWIPIGVYYYGKENMLWVLTPICIMLALGELLRQHYFPCHQQINKLLERVGLLHIMRLNEKKGGLSGATYMLFAAWFCLLVYSNVAFILGFLILVMADSAAAIIGQKYGKHKIIHSKTLQGMLAFLCVALLMYFIVAFVLFRLPLGIHIACILAVYAATAAEVFAITVGIDDNIAVPIACCATYELSLPIFTYLI